MVPLPILVSGAQIAGIIVVLVAIVLITLLVRNRERCPKDGSGMRLVYPKAGKHMVFRCSKCGHEKKTHISKGAR